jgi:hypothetical protein
MKSKLALMGLTAAMVAGQATPAMAINKEWSAALGFLGGVMATRTYDHHREYRREYYGGCESRGYDYPPQQVIVQQPPTVIYQQAPVIVQQPAVQQGHYEWRDEQQWVPGEWRYEEIGCNTYRKTWCPGYYKTVRTQIWVVDDTGCR